MPGFSPEGRFVDAIVLLGNGRRNISSPSYPVLESDDTALAGQAPVVVVQDFNLDGKPDLIFGNGELALGDGKGGFVLSTPLLPFQMVPVTSKTAAFPLVQMDLAGTSFPSLVYLLPAATPPAASVFTPQTSWPALVVAVTAQSEWRLGDARLWVCVGRIGFGRVQQR